MPKELNKKRTRAEVKACSWWFNIPEHVMSRVIHNYSDYAITEILKSYAHFIRTNTNTICITEED